MTRVMIDAIHACVDHVPSDAPTVAGYLTGTPDIRWTAGDWGRFKHRKVHIAQNYTEGLIVVDHLDVLDVESGALTFPEAVDLTRRRAAKKLHTTIYMAASNLPGMRDAINAAGLEEWVTYWVANWSLTQAEAEGLLGHGRIVAVQYASPTSNPNDRMPGSHATLREANVDLSVALPTWLPETPAKHKAKPKVKVHPKVTAAALGGAIAAAATSVAHNKGVHLTGAEATVIAAFGAFLGGYLKRGET